MTEHLRQVLAQVEQLDSDSQEAIADTIEAKLAELAEARWQELFADSRSHAFFDELLAQAEAAEANGTTRDLDELLNTVR
jgi:hypothetical protein